MTHAHNYHDMCMTYHVHDDGMSKFERGFKDVSFSLPLVTSIISEFHRGLSNIFAFSHGLQICAHVQYVRQCFICLCHYLLWQRRTADYRYMMFWPCSMTCSADDHHYKSMSTSTSTYSQICLIKPLMKGQHMKGSRCGNFSETEPATRGHLSNQATFLHRNMSWHYYCA